MDDAVHLGFEGAIAILTLNRPASLNAMSGELVACLERRLDELAARPDVRVVIVTGTGRAFSAGGDLLEFERALRADKQSLLDTLAHNQDVLQRVEDLPMPVIGAVNGVAVAGGLELLLCCDILIAAEGARLGDGHVRYGVVPAGGATVRLTERLSPSHAAQLFYSAALVDARTLRDWGLVNEIVGPDSLIDRAMELAREIARHSPQAIRHTKALTRDAARRVERQARIRREIERFAAHVDGADLGEGLAAFRAKRPPCY